MTLVNCIHVLAVLGLHATRKEISSLLSTKLPSNLLLEGDNLRNVEVAIQIAFGNEV